MERNSLTPALEKAEKVEEAVERAVEKVADELQVALPVTESNPFGVRIITLLALLGGIAIVGSMFADSFSLYQVPALFYFFRLSIGLLLIFIAYGLNHKKLYAIWLLGLVVLLGMLLNPLVSVLPVVAMVYLYQNREQFIETGRVTFRTITLRF